MKKQLILCAILLASFMLTAQEKTANISMGKYYANEVYYKLSTETVNEYSRELWDVAFFKDDRFNMGIRVNDRINVYEASNKISDWDNIDVANLANWKQLYNSLESRLQGAFQQGSAEFGWGTYDQDHHVRGAVVFVLKYPGGEYKKLIIEDYWAGYTIKYATWDATTSSWGADVTKTISNSSSINNGNSYNYFSLLTGEEVVAEPKKTEWDFVFTKYIGDRIDNSGKPYKYLLTGALQSDKVKVAEKTGNDTNNLDYSDHINVIGDDWKELNFAAMKYVVDSDKKFYIKYEDGTIYKMWITEFEGMSTGNVEFKFEDVTALLGIEDVTDNVAFGVYPNPINADRKVNILFDVNKTNNDKNKIEIYNINGQKVHQKVVTNTQGFYDNEVDLQGLSSGVYILKFTSGDFQKTKKIVLN